MSEMPNLAELVNSKIVKPVQERFQQQKQALENLENLCRELSAALDQQKRYAAELEQKIAALTEKQQQLSQTLSDEHSRRQEMESAISAINWEE